MKVLLVATVFSVACFAGAAQISPVGNWTSKISMDWSKLPTNMTSDPKFKSQKTMMENQLKNFIVKLAVKKDGTYNSKATGVPGGKKDETEGGKWTSSGSQITFIDSKGSKQLMTLSKDGKTITGDMSPGANLPKGALTVVFSKS